MADTDQDRRRKRLALNPDILSFATASLLATIVMAVGFFWLKADGVEVAIRAGLVFVITCVVVFLLIRCILRTVLAEMIESRRRRQEAPIESEPARETPPSARGTPGI